MGGAGKDSDLFICEAYFFSRPVNKHLSCENVAARLPEIKPKPFLLTHLNQERLDRLMESQYPLAQDGNDHQSSLRSRGPAGSVRLTLSSTFTL